MGIKISPETILALQQHGMEVGTVPTQTQPGVPPATPPVGTPATQAPPLATPPGVTINMPGIPPMQQQQQAPPVVQPSPAAAPVVQQSASTQAILANAGVTEAMLRQEMLQYGGITQSTYSKLAGIDNSYLNAVFDNVKLTKQVQGFQADAQKVIEKTIYDSFGGEQNFKTVVAAIRPNLSDAEVQSINGMLESGDQITVNAAVQYIKSKQQQYAGSLNLTLPQNLGATQQQHYMSKEEYRKALSSKEYATDPNYRATVDRQRLAAKQWEEKTFARGTYWRRGPDGNYIAL